MGGLGRVAARWRARSSDAGFTLIEIMVSIAVISIVMMSLLTFFVGGLSSMSQLTSRQAAAQLAGDANEMVRAMNSSQLLTGRDKTSSDTQWSTGTDNADVAPLLATMQEDYDDAATFPDGQSAALPTTGRTVTVNGLDYVQNWYIGDCWAPPLSTGTVTCDTPEVSGYIQFYRVVVAVTWTDRHCASGTCTYAAAAVTNTLTTDPLFNPNATMINPAIVNPGDQISEIGVALPPMQMSANGGKSPLSWDADNLPDGLVISDGGVISGTPTATGTFTVTLMVTDAGGQSDPNPPTLVWTVNATPLLTSPGAQDSPAGTALSLAVTMTGGTTPVTWSATGLPAGLTIDGTTGGISGTPTTGAGPATVTVTVTDALAQTAGTSFTWAILAITAPADQVGTADVAVTPVPVAASGGTTPYTSYGATGLPPGLSIDAATGQIAGTPTVAGVYSVVVTVTDASGVPASASFTWTVA